MTTRRQVVKRVADHSVVLDFKLMSVFENEHGLRQISDRSFSGGAAGAGSASAWGRPGWSVDKKIPMQESTPMVQPSMLWAQDGTDRRM